MAEQETNSTLELKTFEELFNEERLPSGLAFKLMPDTVETALKVAEADGTQPWKKKALQAYTVTRVVGDVDLHDEEEGQSPEFVHHMIEADVIFLTLAWSAQLNGTSMALTESVPCPTCAHPFKEIGFGNLKVLCRPDVVGGPSAMWPVEDVVDADLPKSLKGHSMYVVDPTWTRSKKGLSERSWGNQDVVAIHRAAASMRVAKSGKKSPRSVVRPEWMALRTRTLNSVIKVMEQHIPHFEERLELKCKNCENISIVPFNEGLG